MINYARIYFDNNIIEEVDGEFINLYYKLFKPTDEQINFDKQIGNINELINPYYDSTYKNYSNNEFTSQNANEIFLDKNYNRPPSIKEYILVFLYYLSFMSGNNIPSNFT